MLYSSHVALYHFSEVLHKKTFVSLEKWPEYDEAKTVESTIEIAVQINGKTKVVISVPADISKEDAIAEGKAALGDKLSGNVVKEIYVPGRIINLVVK